MAWSKTFSGGPIFFAELVLAFLGALPRKCFVIRRMTERNARVGPKELSVYLLGGRIGDEEMIEDWRSPCKRGVAFRKPSREEILHCGAFEVARFLESIECERRMMVGDLSSRSSLLSGAEALLGMAAV